MTSSSILEILIVVSGLVWLTIILVTWPVPTAIIVITAMFYGLAAFLAWLDYKLSSVVMLAASVVCILLI